MVSPKKISTPEVRGNEKFFILKFFLFFISTTFWKNDCSATWLPNIELNIFDMGHISICSRFQKKVQSLWRNSLVDFDMFKLAVYI